MFQRLPHLKENPIFNNMKWSIWSISNSVYHVSYKVVAPVGFTVCLVMTLLPPCMSGTQKEPHTKQDITHHLVSSILLLYNAQVLLSLQPRPSAQWTQRLHRSSPERTFLQFPFCLFLRSPQCHHTTLCKPPGICPEQAKTSSVSSLLPNTTANRIGSPPAACRLCFLGLAAGWYPKDG